MNVRRDLPRVALSIGAAVTIVGSLRPWVASGRVDRSSYEIIDLVDRLGFAEEGPFELALRAWPLMPLLVVAATVAMWWRRHLVGPALALLGGVYAFCVALAVRLAPSAGLLRIRAGTTVTVVGALIFLAGTLVAVVLEAVEADPRAAAADQPATGRPAA
ncbi:MAG: hypothetical protein ACRDZZ_14515 [Ilumatobacteraceae bacterium]